MLMVARLRCMPLNIALLLIPLLETRVQSLFCPSLNFGRPTAQTRLHSKREYRSGADEWKSNKRRYLIANIVLGPLYINKAQAACLSGDIREECIGVYKMPMDDEALSYVDTPEKLNRFAPDLNWVPPVEYPSSYKSAVTQLNDQKAQLDNVQDNVAKGALNQGGLLLLDIIPKVTAAGKVILLNLTMASNEEKNMNFKKGKVDPTNSGNSIDIDMKAMRIEYSLNEVLGYLGETDVLIGQGLRGQLGVSAPAQIQIMSSLSEARREFDELLRAVPEGI
ncbi:hypothetical protein ACHAXS_005090 [Conticribra weissflogii]